MNLDKIRLTNSPRILIHEVGFLTTKDIENSIILPAKYAWPLSLVSWFGVFFYAYSNGHLINPVFILIGFIAMTAATAISLSTIASHLEPCDDYLCSILEPIIDYDEKTFLALRRVKERERELTKSEAMGIINYVREQKRASHKRALYAKRETQYQESLRAKKTPH